MTSSTNRPSGEDCDPAWRSSKVGRNTSPTLETCQERMALLMSIQPRFAAAIMSGSKTVELRRRPPRTQPGLVLVYSSGARRELVGAAALTAIHTGTPTAIWRRFGSSAGVSRTEFDEYFCGCEQASALELTEPASAQVPMPLADLRAHSLEPPQSWRYVSHDLLEALLADLYPHGSQVGHRVHPVAGLATGEVETTTTADLAQRALRPWRMAWRGLNSSAAWALRCAPLTAPQRLLSWSTDDSWVGGPRPVRHHGLPQPPGVTGGPSLGIDI